MRPGESLKRRALQLVGISVAYLALWLLKEIIGDVGVRAWLFYLVGLLLVAGWVLLAGAALGIPSAIARYRKGGVERG